MGKRSGAEHIRFLSDGNGEFTLAMGMLVGKEDLSFGERSWRYSMLVRDEVVEKMFIEFYVEGYPFNVSDANTMLNYINPNAAKIAFVELNLPNATCGVMVGALTGAVAGKATAR